MLGACAFTLSGGALFANAHSAFAATTCANGDKTYVVHAGDTLDSIAKSHQTTWQALSAHNKLANANVISVNQTLCIPVKVAAKTAPTTVTKPAAPVAKPAAPAVKAVSQAAHGTANIFPYGQCTWWADNRYHQLTGIYVPWMTNSDAYLWTERAHQYHWNVSSTPHVGDIMQLDRGVQGTGQYGHVGVVESIDGKGRFTASQMNWNGVGVMTKSQFSVGAGVHFISAK
ncbi:peptidase M23 [Dictyobacter sp. S3.2.2.5]|uniref:Peptidase M23 n=1 Tax=Dictyobacter halimunensis TaxID=3026934 RepID=A0ABQ6FUV6_9CHLR|nr:peptidase M23 [Dictyobacter sp. S3.2.2.5]